MHYLIAFIFYLIMHFNFYCFHGRYNKWLCTEKGIFLYHFISFVSVGLLTPIILFRLYGLENIFQIGLSAIALHGIYSLSFLELWSLAQGSFSISVLRSNANKLTSQNEVIANLTKIGDDKFVARLNSLQELGLLEKSNSRVISLTTKGRLVAIFLGFVVKFTNIKDFG